MKRPKTNGLPAGTPVEITVEELPFYIYGVPPVLRGYAEVAVHLRLSEQWVKDMAEESDMPSVRTGGVVTFPTGALVRWLFLRYPNRAPVGRAKGVCALRAAQNDEGRGAKSEGGVS